MGLYWNYFTEFCPKLGFSCAFRLLRVWSNCLKPDWFSGLGNFGIPMLPVSLIWRGKKSAGKKFLFTEGQTQNLFAQFAKSRNGCQESVRKIYLCLIPPFAPTSKNAKLCANCRETNCGRIFIRILTFPLAAILNCRRANV